jgi:uncharacterized protein YgiM (DUF1202 family)
MDKNAKGLLPKVEIVIVAIFALSFLIWIVPKCGSGRPVPEADPESLVQADTVQETPAAVVSSTDTTTRRESPRTPVATTPSKPEAQLSRLYIIIDGLNLRTEPGLKSTVLTALPLFEEVYFLNEVTDSTTELSLGYETANEPWVKIRTKKGREGWVYGAGVSYYKKKRSGTLE